MQLEHGLLAEQRKHCVMWGDVPTSLGCLESLGVCYESWVVPAGVPSALADILGAEFR